MKLIFEGAIAISIFEFQSRKFQFFIYKFFEKSTFFENRTPTSRGCSSGASYRIHAKPMPYESIDLELSLDIKIMSVGWKFTSVDKLSWSFSIFLDFPRVCTCMRTLRMVLPGGRLPEAVTSALVVGIARNHHQMKALSLYFHLAVVSCNSHH